MQFWEDIQSLWNDFVEFLFTLWNHFPGIRVFGSQRMDIENKGFFGARVRKFAKMAEKERDFADADLGKFYFIKPAFFHPPFFCG